MRRKTTKNKAVLSSSAIAVSVAYAKNGDRCLFNSATIKKINGEQREFILGYSLAYRVLFVVYIERNQRIWVISARPATRKEKKQYEQT
ncbi:MAG: BrnT family toxin [Crocosphaera sp.]